MVTIEKIKNKARHSATTDRTFLSGWLAFLRQNSVLLLKFSIFLAYCHYFLEERQRGFSDGPEHQLVSLVEGITSTLLFATGPLTLYSQ